MYILLKYNFVENEILDELIYHNNYGKAWDKYRLDNPFEYDNDYFNKYSIVYAFCDGQIVNIIIDIDKVDTLKCDTIPHEFRDFLISYIKKIKREFSIKNILI